VAVDLSPVVSILPAKPEDVLELSVCIRSADRLEAEALGVSSVEEELMAGLRCSSHAWTGRANGEIVCVFGAAMRSQLLQSASVWLVGSVCLERYARPFLRHSLPYLSIMLASYRYLSNYVDVRNRKAIRWLTWLGADFEATEYLGPKRMPFYRFSFTAGREV
jgi:hypothetical protein